MTVLAFSIKDIVDDGIVLGKGADAAAVVRCRFTDGPVRNEASAPDAIMKVLKPEFQEGGANARNWEALKTIIEWAQTLDSSQDPVDRMLWESCAWPIGWVTTNGKRSAILQRWHESSGVWKAPTAAWVDAAYLALPRDLLGEDKSELFFDTRTQFGRLGTLGRIIVELNSRGVILGDIKPDNFLVVPPKKQISQGNGVYLIDTDSFTISGKAAFSVNRPSIPTTSPSRTIQADGELFGLMAIHTFLRDTSAREGAWKKKVNQTGGVWIEELNPVKIEHIYHLAMGDYESLSDVNNLLIQWSAFEEPTVTVLDTGQQHRSPTVDMTEELRVARADLAESKSSLSKVTDELKKKQQALVLVTDELKCVKSELEKSKSRLVSSNRDQAVLLRVLGVLHVIYIVFLAAIWITFLDSGASTVLANWLIGILVLLSGSGGVIAFYAAHKV